MSKRLFRKVLAAAATITLMVPACLPAQDSSEKKLHQLEERLEKEPEAVLESLSRLEADLKGEIKLLQRSRFLRGQALLELDRNAEAEVVLKSLLGELTADAESDPLLISRTALGLGKTLNHQSRPSEGEAALTLALRQLPENAPPEIRARILLEMTRVMIYLGEPINAADQATEALEWAKAHNLNQIALQARYLLGYAYRNQDDITAARPHFQNAREEARRLGDLRYEILSMNELGNLLVMEKKPDAAMKIKQEALDRARKINDDYLVSICLHDIGYALILGKKYSRALEIYRSIIQRETALENPRAINMAKLNITYIYSEMGRWREALELAEQTLDSVRRNQLGELEPKLLEQVIDLLERQGRNAEALKRQKELTELNDRKFRRELERKLTEIRDRYRLMEQESEIRILRQDKEIRSLQLGRQRILILSMIGLAFFLLLMAVLAFFGYRTKRRANCNLEILNRRLDELSRHDALTKLSNRRDMMEKLQILKARADRDGSPLSMLMIDMDLFKSINDTWGHEQGDRVLQAVARTLRERIRGQDLLARWGGEEFLVALAGTARKGALQAAEQLRRAVEITALQVDGATISVTITVGVAQYKPKEDLQTVITRADNQLYEGKRAGRNRVSG
ncbi:MAG: diguanylate cyclase [Candidatus Aminicenantes bacterium]|nr:diguanylate cyclase [Candidatus Aminicenantes bacterium]